MPKVQKPGFTYGYSEELHLEWAINDKTGTLTTEDGVHYTVAEQNLLYHRYGVIPGNIHAIKKVFKGTLVPPDADQTITVPEKTEQPKQPSNSSGELFDIY